MQYAKLISEGDAAPLGQDPFARVHVAQPSASWRGQAVRLLSGHAGELSPRGHASMDEARGLLRSVCGCRHTGAAANTRNCMSRAEIQSAVRWLARLAAVGKTCAFLKSRFIKAGVNVLFTNPVI